MSNDRVLHGMTSGTTGGVWPTSYIPGLLNGPAQWRPPVLQKTVGTASRIVAVGAQDGRVYLFDAETGSEIWSVAVPGAEVVQGAPSVMVTEFGGVADLVIVGTRNATSGNRIVALNLTDGTVAWTFDNGGGTNAIGAISAPPMIDYINRRVYFTSRTRGSGSQNTVWALDITATSATLAWAKNTTVLGDSDVAPTLWKGVLYVADNNGRVCALDPGTGNVHWCYDTGDGAVKMYVFPEIGIAGNALFISTGTKIWHLIDNGTTVTIDWQATLGPGITPSAPLHVPGTNWVLVGGSDGRLYKLDATSGNVLSSLALTTDQVGAPAYDVRTGLVYVGAEDGKVYAVDPAQF